MDGQNLDLSPDEHTANAWPRLKARIEYFERHFPHDAVAFAGAHREEVAPHLAAAVEAIADDPAPAIDGSYMLHLFAMHLLAAWRDTRAYPALVRWGHFSEDCLDQLLGDVVHESYGRCLASVCDGDTRPIRKLAEDPKASVWARWAALTALTTRVIEGDDTREFLMDYLLHFGTVEAARMRREGLGEEMDILNAIVSCACDIGATEMLPAIRGWFADNLLDEQFADLAWVEKDIARPFEAHRDDAFRHNDGYVASVAKEMAWFASYKDNDVEESDGLEPYVRPIPKVGRNDPCPCGSGKKYKKCCGG